MTEAEFAELKHLIEAAEIDDEIGPLSDWLMERGYESIPARFNSHGSEPVRQRKTRKLYFEWMLNTPLKWCERVASKSLPTIKELK